MKKICRDIIILYMSTKNDDQMMYCSWDMVCDRCNCYFSFWAIFSTFTPLKAQKIKILKKWKKCLDISSFYMCTKNCDQIMYSSWDMVHDRCNCCFSFWAVCCPFTPQQPKKPKFWKNEKNFLEISSFYICIPKIMIRWCTVPEIWCMTDVIIFHFGPFFSLLSP